MIDIKDLDKVSSGQSLSLEERALLEPALIALKQKQSLLKVGFWGRINGEAADYIIVVGLTKTPFLAGGEANKSFFYCTSNQLKLVPLPLGQSHPEVSERTKFSGDPTLELAKIAISESKDEEDVGEMQPYLEVDYLGYIVSEIDWHSAVCPKGAFSASPSHKIMESISFGGLSHSDASQLTSYLHFRRPADETTSYDKKGIIKPTDFLDDISTSHPRGGWALNLNAQKSQVNIRSLLYPGYSFYHEIGTRGFGGFYVGDGVRNSDIAFML